MRKHASIEDLARYDAEDLRPRKRARVSAHLAVCVHCSENRHRLHAVASVLADVSYPAMPEHLSARIDVAIASESAARVSSEPATELGRGALPERQPARARRSLSRLTSPLGMRLAAAAGAAVVVAGGSYALVNGLSSIGASSQPSTAGAGAPMNRPAHLIAGPVLRYTIHGHADQIQTVHSPTNFEQGTFQTEALAAVRAKRAGQVNQTPVPNAATAGGRASSTTPSSPLPSASLGQPMGPLLSGTNLSRLRACVELVAAGRALLLVESAKFDSSPAIIVVVQPAGSSTLQAYALGSACSGTDKDILYSIRLPQP